MAKNFTDQYKDARWQKKRLEIMERDGFKCRSCGRGDGDEIMLSVHHAYYESGKKVWDYPNETLITWCQECHEKRHKCQKEIALYLSALSKDDHQVVYEATVGGGIDMVLMSNVLFLESMGDKELTHRILYHMLDIVNNAVEIGRERVVQEED